VGIGDLISDFDQKIRDLGCEICDLRSGFKYVCIKDLGMALRFDLRLALHSVTVTVRPS